MVFSRGGKISFKNFQDCLSKSFSIDNVHLKTVAQRVRRVPAMRDILV